jgi:hypothetical protein
MAENNRGTASWIIEIGVLVPAILSASLPSPFTMRTFAHDKESVRTLRIGEIVGGGMVLALGVAESYDKHSIGPLVVVVLVSATWFMFIEWAIRNPINGGTNMTNGASNVSSPDSKTSKGLV